MRKRWVAAVGLAALAATSGPAVAEAPPPPTASAPVVAGPGGGNAIDTLNRAAVRTAYRERYAALLGTPMRWTGSVNGCRPGSVSPAFRTATRTAVNFFRGMVGLPGVTFEAGLNAKAQAAALIMDAANTLNHFPSAGARCSTAAGRDGARHANLAQGEAGPAAIGLYVNDVGSGNVAAGHRRWLLYPPQRRMGSGSTNSGGTRWDALYVVHSASWSRPVNEPDWVSWPTPGFVPHPLLFPRFSLGGDVPADAFASATVRVTRNGTVLPAQVVSRTAAFGDPTIVFDVDLRRLARGPNMNDTNLLVEVDGIDLGGGNIVDRAWTTTVFSSSRATSPPADNAFASAQELSSPTDSAWGRNVDATVQAGEPQHAGVAGGHSVWYRFTAAADGPVTIDTVGSAFDTTLAVYTGSPVTALTPVASNDDTGPGTTSQVSFAATAGTTYRIAVDGKAGATGRITLNWSLPT
jgi:hypothetical protein